MRFVHVAALWGLFLLLGFIAWLGQRGDNDTKVYVGLIGTLVLIGLIALFATYARAVDEAREKQYFAIIGTALGLVGGLVGGAAIGNSAGQAGAQEAGEAAAQDVQQQVETTLDEGQAKGGTPKGK